VAAMAESVERFAGGEPFALLGYSSGALLAQAIAQRLQRSGVVPEAVVLIDAYLLGESRFPRLVRGLLHAMSDRLDQHALTDDVRLTAMGGYLRLLDSWRPEAITPPTLLVRASQPLPAWADVDDWRSAWPLPHAAVDAEGDHFSLIEGHAGSTARAVEEWLLATCPSPSLTTTKEQIS